MKKLIILISMLLLMVASVSAVVDVIDTADNYINGGNGNEHKYLDIEYDVSAYNNISSVSVQLKFGFTPTTNYTLPQSCAIRDPIRFSYRVRTSVFAVASADFYCLDGANQIQLITSRTNYTGNTNTPSVTGLGELSRAYDNNYNTAVLGYNYEWWRGDTAAVLASQRADSVLWEESLIVEYTYPTTYTSGDSLVSFSIPVDPAEVDIGVDYITVDSSSPANVPATISFSNVPTDVVPYRDGVICESQCSNIVNNGTLTFDVSGFSTYSYGAPPTAAAVQSCQDTKATLFAAFLLIGLFFIVGAGFALVTVFNGGGADSGMFLTLTVSFVGLAIVLFVGMLVTSRVALSVCGM